MEKTAVLCVAALPPPHHGVSLANELLLNNDLVRDRYDLRIIPLSKPKLYFGGDLSLGTFAKDLSATYEFLKEIMREKPQLIYFVLAQTKLGLWRNLIWMGLGKLRGSKCLAHLHGGYFRIFFEKEFSRTGQKFLKAIISRLDGVIVLDPILVSLFEGLLPEDRIFILRNGIPESVSAHDLEEANRLRAGQKKLRVTFLSNLIPGKGYDTFLETAALLKKQGRERDFVFNLAGAPSNAHVAREVEEFLQSFRLEGLVHILGKVFGGEKWNLLLNSDVFVFPTENEGQPFAIIEAMSAGLPIISTARGAIPAMVQDGVNGFIVQAGNPLEIVERLYLLQQDASLRLAMGRASRELYRKDYSLEEFIQGFMAILDRVIRST
jgi:glycosyltransferase involved in cell wall biosynthesis